MTHPLTDDDTQFPTALSIVDGDAANGATVDAIMQPLADRTANLKKRIGGLVSDNGIVNVRWVTSIAALQGLSGMATGDLCVVHYAGIHTYSAPAMYLFDAASSLGALGTWVVAPTAGSGRWVHMGYADTALVSGGVDEYGQFATVTLDAFGKVDPRLIYRGLVTTPSLTSLVGAQTTTGTSYADVSGLSLSLANLVAGDFIEVRQGILLSNSGANSTSAIATIIDGASTVQPATSEVVIPTGIVGAALKLTGEAIYVVVTGGTVTVKTQMKVSGGTGTAGIGSYIRAKVIRP